LQSLLTARLIPLRLEDKVDWLVVGASQEVNTLFIFEQCFHDTDTALQNLLMAKLTPLRPEGKVD
jgi:hypothetical protein